MKRAVIGGLVFSAVLACTAGCESDGLPPGTEDCVCPGGLYAGYGSCEYPRVCALADDDRSSEGAVGGAGGTFSHQGNECFDVVPCEGPQACEENEDGVFVCSACKDELCPAGEECGSSGRCFRPKNCGYAIPCQDGGMCDPKADACYPENGRCTSSRDCPRFSSTLMSIARLDCTDAGYCQLEPTAPTLDWLDQGENRDIHDNIEVLSPEPGSVFTQEDDPVFEWERISGGAFLRVTNQIPRRARDWSSSIVWGASVEEGKTEIRFSAGHLFVGDRWVPADELLPEGVYFFFVVSLDSSGDWDAMNRPVPFLVSGEHHKDFLLHGADCSTDAECYNPTQVQLCIDSNCAQACASHQDCPGAARCLGLMDGVRICED